MVSLCTRTSSGLTDSPGLSAPSGREALAVGAKPRAHGEEGRDRRLVRLAGRPVTDIKRVGSKSAAALGELGIQSVLDLLTYYPRRYIDRTNSCRIAELVPGEEAVVLATVAKVEARRPSGRRTLVIVVLDDGTGLMRCSFFNQPWRAKQLEPGTEVVVAGKVGNFRGRVQMTNPTVDIVGKPGMRRTGRLVPVYRQSEKAGLSTWDMHPWIGEALRRTGALSDPVPEVWRKKLNLVERTIALHDIHFPRDHAARAAARRRVVFDEMLRLQLVLIERKRELELTERGIAHEAASPFSPGSKGSGTGLLERFLTGLPFELTSAQKRAITEIASDMAAPRPMHRLLQGDVGSGKTLVAVSAVVMAAQGGHQAALMAPTEVLAEQHALSIRSMVAGLQVDDESTLSGSRSFRVELLTGSVPLASRKRILAGLARGEVDLVVGTHALLSGGVEFHSLGLVVVDEQHRFGVEQRAQLRAKRSDGRLPDVLAMTATPIPRSVAMTVFGDLDTTVLDELPPGRTPVVTEWLRFDEEPAWERVRSEVAAGRQAYVVCPLVEESEAVQAKAATEELYRLGEGPLAGIDLGLVHGQMQPAEKERSMEAFRSGATPVLVSTTVIEVGVDVPNATVMVVEDAWRFGIAQLHQLRGRVGRGVHQSYCYLLGDPPSSSGTLGAWGTLAEQRLVALSEISDGFRLAEADLELRGEGAVTGAAQSGRSSLRLGSVLKDRDLVEAARKVAVSMVDAGWRRDCGDELAVEIELMVGESEAGFLTKG